MKLLAKLDPLLMRSRFRFVALCKVEFLLQFAQIASECHGRTTPDSLSKIIMILSNRIIFFPLIRVPEMSKKLVLSHM